MCRTIVSSRRALYSTPSWFGHGQQEGVGRARRRRPARAPRRSRRARRCSSARTGRARRRGSRPGPRLAVARRSRRRSRSVTIGSTLRLTDTRGSRSCPAAAHASRNSAICSACSSSNGTPVSSISSVELIRFMPCSPAHTRGLAGARAPPDPVGQPGRLRLDRRASPRSRPAAGVGVHDAGAGDRGAEAAPSSRGRGRRRSALGRHVAERLRAAAARSRASRG